MMIHPLHRGPLIVAMAACMTMLLGCSNPFKQFYKGQSVAQLNGDKPWIETSAVPATVVQTGNIGPEIESRVQDGAILLGQSNWFGADVGTEGQARQQAKDIGATTVLWSYQYAGSTSGVMPITTPTVSTTYGGGTVYGTYGSATWTGSATSYGTTTTYMPYTVHRYNVNAAFLAMRTRPPRLGIYPRELTPAEQSAAGTTQGLLIMLVVRRSPAAEAGILPNDVICSVAGLPLTKPDDMTAALERHAGQTVEVVLRRNGQELRMSIQLNP
jgi:membrane-associated protease RseP (regulator of RpoE activity)